MGGLKKLNEQFAAYTKCTNPGGKDSPVKMSMRIDCTDDGFGIAVFSDDKCETKMEFPKAMKDQMKKSGAGLALGVKYGECTAISKDVNLKLYSGASGLAATFAAGAA